MCAYIFHLNHTHTPSIMALRGLEVTHCESQHSQMESSPVRAFHLSWQVHKYAESTLKQQYWGLVTELEVCIVLKGAVCSIDLDTQNCNIYNIDTLNSEICIFP